VTWALAPIVILMAGEIVAGILAHSLALLSDAGHMLTDIGALALSIVALRLAARPARGALTYGLGRAEALSAQANGITLVIIAGLVVYSAVGRLVSPPHVSAWPVVALALAGLAVEGSSALTLAGARESGLAIEGSFQHLVTDLYAFAGTLVAGVVILLTGFDRADPIASLVVAALMVRSAFALIRASSRVFLEAAPERLDPQAIGNALAGEAGVVEVHDLHVWEVRTGFAALSAHVTVGREADCHETRRALEAMLHERFDLQHTTLQVDHEGEQLLELQLPARPLPPR
jgi:cobalt-zinc-cadmium efflux system protein